MHNSIKKLLRNTAIVRHQTGKMNSAGELIVGDPITYPCRIESVNVVFYDKNGIQINSKNKAFLAEDAVVANADLVTLQGEPEGPIMRVEKHYGVSGKIDHYVIYT